MGADRAVGGEGGELQRATTTTTTTAAIIITDNNDNLRWAVRDVSSGRICAGSGYLGNGIGEMTEETIRGDDLGGDMERRYGRIWRDDKYSGGIWRDDKYSVGKWE
jgi:hypothetical protein